MIVGTRGSKLATTQTQTVVDDLEKIIDICKREGLKVEGTVFLSNPNELEDVISLCRENNIKVSGTVFRKKAKELKKIISLCKENDIKLSGTVFSKSAKDLEDIINVCKKYNIKLEGAVFRKKASEIEDIVKVCREYNIDINGGIFYRSGAEIRKSSEYLTDNYDSCYVKNLIVCKPLERLKEVFPYLDSLGVLPVVVKSPGILELNLSDIKEREITIKNLNMPMIDNRGMFNTLFSLNKNRYNARIEKIKAVLHIG